MRKLKLVTTLLSTVMIFSLVACGGSNTASNQKTEAATESKAVAEAKTEAIKETAAKETTKPTTVAPTQEVTTKQQDNLKYFTKQIDLSIYYISPENCKKIVDMFDGVTIKKGDSVNIEDIPFTGAEIEGKNLFLSLMAYITSSDMETGVYVLTAKLNANLKVRYDNNFLYIDYAQYK